MAIAITITPTQILRPVNDLDNDGVADPGEVVSTTILVSSVGTNDAQALTIADTLNGLTLVNGTLKVTPIAFDDGGYTATGNTPITFTGGQLTANDVDPDGGAQPTLTVTAVSNATGGTVSLANGTITFVPTTGFTGTASFQYTVTDAQGLSSVSTGTVTMTVSDKVWYVDSTYAGANGAADGSYLRPFTSLAPLNNSANDPDGVGDTIFVYNRGTAYTGGLTLEAGQSLIGDGVAFSRNGLTIGASTTNATIDTATTGITLSSGNTISGVTVNTTAAGAIGIQDGNGTVGTLTINNTSVTGVGKAVDIDQGGTLAVAFDTLSSTGSASEGIHLQGVGGSFAATTGTISGATNQGVLIGQAGGALANSGGTVGFSYGGAVTNNGAGVAGIEIQDHATGAISFSGAISDTSGTGILVDTNTGTLTFGGPVSISSGTANGVVLTNAGTVVFTGTGQGLDITTTSGIGFTATGGGSVSVQGSSNTVSTATGTAVNVNATTNSGMTWQAINTTNADIGINLQNTGSGAFAVTGTGTTGSGGTIAGATTGINLLNTGALNLTQVRIIGDTTSDDGIYGQNVNGLTLTNVTVSGNPGSGQITDRGVEIVNLTGTATVTNSTFTNMPGHLFNVKNSTGTLALTITGSTFSGSQVSGVGGDDGILIENDGTSVINARITNSTFSNNEGDHIQWAGDGGLASGQLTISSNNFSMSNPGDGLGGGITISPSGAGSLIFLVSDNVITGNIGGGAIDVTATSTTTQSNVQGTIRNNQVGTAGAVNSGSAQASGISVELNGNGTLTTLVTGNTVNQVNGNYGIEVFARSGTGGGVLNATVSGNTVANPGANMLNAIRVTGGTSLGTDVGTINLDILNNNVDTTVASDIRITSNGDVNMYFAGLGGSTVAGGSNAAAIKTYLEGRNPGNETASVFYNTSNNTAVWGSVASVTQPASTTAPLLALPETSSSTAPATVAPDATAPDVSSGPASGEAPPAPASTHPVIVDDGVLTQVELDYLVDAAIARWAAAGATEAQLAAMRAATVTLTDMAGPYLGVSSGRDIAIDTDGAGYGWFLDATPADDAEFTGTGTRLTATGSAAGKVDLLTTLMHELGHQIGIDDDYAVAAADALMYGYIVTGERRTPAAGDLAQAGTGPVADSSFALAPVTIGTLPSGKSVQISFDATVNTPAPGLSGTITNTTTVSGTGFSVTGNRSLTIDTLTLGNLVFLDANSNGRFDAGDSGIVGVTLSLFVDSNGNGVLDGAEATTVIATTTTGAGGAYQFSSLAAGNYVVRVDASNFNTGSVLNGRVNTTGGADPDDDVDNDSNGITGTGGATISNLITLALNGEPGTDATGKNDLNTTLDFGFVQANVAPTATGLAGDAVTFTEDGAAVRLDLGANAVVSDTATNFAGGSLRVAIGTNKVATEDALGIATTATVSTTATTVSVNGTVIATYVGGGAGGADLVFALVAAATPATVSELLRALTYANTNTANPSTATRTINYTLVDGGGTQGGLGADTLQLNSSVAVVAVDDAPVAVADAASTDERTAKVIAVLTNDTDVDGGPKSVAKINGVSVVSGQTVTLSNSVATVTLNADGTLSYNSNGQFDWLVSPAKAALDPTYYVSSAIETFSYSLNGGSTQTVTITITGVDTAGDQLRGTGGADAITGTDGADIINLSAGGSDIASGGLGNDGFFMGAALDAGDRIDGGAGTGDQVGLQGNYATQLVLGADTIKNVEMLVFLPGNDTRFGVFGGGLTSYNIKTNDANVAAGQQFVVQANTLRAGETLTFDGSAETDGYFLTYGGLGTDVLTGGAQNDGFYFGQDRFNATDRINGGGGSMDQLGLQGDYSGAKAITFGAAQLTNIEMIVLLSGGDARFGGGARQFSYTLTMDDANAVGSGPMTVQANGLRSDEVLILDASRETSTPYTIFGGAAADTITGGAGADTLWGRGGGDTLRGGAGNDVFAYFAATDSFGTGANRDTILDFARGDRIDVSRMGLSSFVSTFTGAGQIRSVGSGSNWVIEGDVNGDGVADLSIAVTTTAGFSWSAADFTLAPPASSSVSTLVMDSHAFTL